MPRKKHRREEIVAKLCQVDVLVVTGPLGPRSGSFDRRDRIAPFSWTPSLLILRQGGHDGHRQFHRRLQVRCGRADHGTGFSGEGGFQAARVHEQQVVILGRGLTVFRPAMTVHLNPRGGQFAVQHFTPLEEHYTEQTIQTHVMAAYVEKGLTAMDLSIGAQS